MRLPRLRIQRRAFTPIWVAVAVLLSLAGFFDLGPKLEKSVGKETFNSVKKDPGFNQTPLLIRYVQTLGARLGQVADRKTIRYNYNIVNMDEENAFAAGAGYTFVTMGMLKMSDTEDEVAVVMAHETGHNSDKHIIKAVKDQLAVTGLFLGLASQMSNDQAYLFGALAQLRSLHYGRQDENRADQLGVLYASRAGYNPYYMLTSFEKLEGAHPTGRMSKLDVALSSHPRTPDRMRKIQGYINVLEANPQDSLQLGRKLYARGYYKESEHYLLAAEKGNPNDPQVHLALAETDRALGEAADEEKQLAAARQIDPRVTLPARNPVVLASAPVSGSPPDYGDLVNSLDAHETFLNGLVETDRTALNDAIDRLDKVAELQAAQEQQQRRNNRPVTPSPAFELAVKAVNELSDLYAMDNNMRRIVAKSKAMLDRTQEIPALYPNDLRAAANCLIGPTGSWKDRDLKTAPQIRDTVFAYAAFPQFYDTSPAELQAATNKARSEKERKQAALKAAFECADNLYALRVTDVFYALEHRYPGAGVAYLSEKTGLDEPAVAAGISAYPKVGYYLAGVNLGARPVKDSKKEKPDFFNRPVQDEPDKEGLWTFYNLAVGDLYRLYAGPQYAPPKVVIEVKQAPPTKAAAGQSSANKKRDTPPLPIH